MIAILERNLKQEDLGYLFENYSQFSDWVKPEILNIAKRYVSVLEQMVANADIKLLFDFLGTISVSKTTKHSVFRLSVNRFAIEQCKNVLQRMGYSNIAKLFVKNAKPKITNTADNKVILDILKNARLIVTYTLDEEHKCYRVTRNKSKNKSLPTELL